MNVNPNPFQSISGTQQHSSRPSIQLQLHSTMDNDVEPHGFDDNHNRVSKEEEDDNDDIESEQEEESDKPKKKKKKRKAKRKKRKREKKKKKHRKIIMISSDDDDHHHDNDDNQDNEEIDDSEADNDDAVDPFIDSDGKAHRYVGLREVGDTKKEWRKHYKCWNCGKEIPGNGINPHMLNCLKIKSMYLCLTSMFDRHV